MDLKIKIFVLCSFAIAASCLYSCKHNSNKEVVTNKIMYDVQIVNDIIGDRSKNNQDWFWANLPTPDGDKFIENLFDDAMNGKLKLAYFDAMDSYDNFKIIPAKDCKEFIRSSMTFAYNELDTTLIPHQIVERQITLDSNNIKDLRFLEEWYTKDNKIHKHVIAVAPMFSVQTPLMKAPIKKVHFWIIMD